jgi:protein-S-isoprenylcysteine O-methyltransferase Ste14
MLEPCYDNPRRPGKMRLMKQLARKPFLFSLILLFPLWIALGNFIVAAILALLIAFLVAMCHALFAFGHREKTLSSPERDTEETRP